MTISTACWKLLMMNKRVNKLLLISFLFFITGNLIAQSDSLNQADTTTIIKIENELPPDDSTIQKTEPKPGSFLLKSAVLPGWGQFANKSYWKIPFAAGGAALGITGIARYSSLYNRYNNAAVDRLDTNKTDEFVGVLPTVELLQKNVEYKNGQTLSIMFTVYAWGINMFDAYRDAFDRQNPKDHSPTKAAFLSALIPGGGQIYNRKYWKLPIVYAALGTGVYFIIDNERRYNDARISYITRNDFDPGSVYETDETIQYSDDNLLTIAEFYRRNRDLSYLITAGLYILNVVDAIVDGHLFNFDISDDLSRNKDLKLNVSPFTTWQTNNNYKGVSFLLTF
jgi:uncharacterized protein DUF5683